MKLRSKDPGFVKKFLSDHWQKKPLLVRDAVIDFYQFINPDELAGLACEDFVESRLVIERNDRKKWHLEQGPFPEKCFSELPDSHWTLLVQDVDKHLPHVSEFLDEFSFIPKWRIDDLMFSYATDQGSVGPHIDNYDVFLIQMEGTRRWMINTQDMQHAPTLTDCDLKILESFEPEKEWLLEPGDMLYLPPGVAHWGIAEGECLTCSVGFRAPSDNELFSSWADHRLEQENTATFYSDPDLGLRKNTSEISPHEIGKARKLINTLLSEDNDSFSRWFCHQVSLIKPGLPLYPPDIDIKPQELVARLKQGNTLGHHPAVKFLTCKHDDIFLYANGNEYSLPRNYSAFLLLIAENRYLDGHALLADWITITPCLLLLTTLYNQGFLVFSDETDCPN